MTLLHGFICGLLPGLNIPAQRSLLHVTSAYNYSLCEENSPFLTPLWTSPLGTHYIRGTPGGETWRDTDKICFPDLCTADAAVSSWRDTLTHYYKTIFNLPNPACLEPSHRSSPRRNLKSHIGYPSIPSLSIKMACLGPASQTCDTHQILSAAFTKWMPIMVDIKYYK